MLFDAIAGLFSSDIAVDLGTASTLVYVKGEGIVLVEPTVVAISRTTGYITAIGNEAKSMIGKAPGSISVIRPLKDGVISHLPAAEYLLRHFIERVHKRRTLVRPRAIVCVPSGIRDPERRAVRDAVEQAGARRVYLVEEPRAAALGAGLPIEEPSGNMIVDIGGGTTEVAVISMGQTVAGHSERVGGDELDDAIVDYLRRSYNVLIGTSSAEQVKIQIGSAYPLKEELKITVKGRDLVTGLPRTIEISSQEVRQALEEPLLSIISAVRGTLERTPPELSADLTDRGIVLAGGGSMLRNLDLRLGEETGVPIHRVEDPVSCVVRGAGKLLDGRADLLELMALEDHEFPEYT